MRRLFFSTLLILLTLLTPAAAWASNVQPDRVLPDGIIIDPPIPCPAPRECPPPPDPRPLFPLAVQYHRVTVTIDNQIATTRVDQLFRNDHNFTVEGTYIFPIPAEAAVSDFAMWVDGQRLQARLLTAEEARAIYDEIVRQTRDPALLEYAGRGAVQASLFPIPPGETRRIELEYQQVLTADNGLLHYRYPLNTEKFSALPLEQVSISVSVVSKEAVRAIYSPSHPIAVARDGAFRFTAGYEASHVTPNTDFDLYYSVAADDIGVNTLTYRDPATGEGFFLLLAAPSLAVDEAQVIAKDVIVVLDQSGSMQGEKFSQAQGALRYVLEHLNPEDRFNIIAFSTGTRAYTARLQPASAAGQAVSWVNGLRAEGGTNINRALLEALATLEADDSERPAIIIFLTDGLATEGVVDTQSILDNVRQAAPETVRLFAFGVGDDVDTVLLDSLVEQNRGASSYVRPGERIDEAVSGFYAKVSTPVLANLSLDFGRIVVDDLYPDPLPDLFAGSQLVVVGRFRDGGTTTVTLSGTVNGARRTFNYPGQVFADSGGLDFIPRLWATRRIGYLLTQIRLHGENPELVSAIVALSVRYGIVTPYTSYLVTENEFDLLTEAGRDELSDQLYADMLATQEEVSGAAAVERAQDQSGLAAAEAPAPVAGEAGNVLRIVGSRTFLLNDGAWMDTAYDASTMQAVPVQFLSDDYFDLLAARPELAPAFALGPRVIALADDGTPYAVTEAEAPPLEAPATYTPPPPGTTPPPASDATATPIAISQVDPNNPPPPPPARRPTACLGALLVMLPAGLAAKRRKKEEG